MKTPVPANRSRAHELNGDERLDELAYRYYGDPGLWRVIAEANNIDDPLKLHAGRLITIPRMLSGSLRE